MLDEGHKKILQNECYKDYGAQKESEIYEKEERLATIEEKKIIIREAISFADNLTKR